MIEEPPGPPQSLQAPVPRECGWFGSSTELREGLEVLELGDMGSGPPAASGPAPQAAPGREAA